MRRATLRAVDERQPRGANGGSGPEAAEDEPLSMRLSLLLWGLMGALVWALVALAVHLL